MTYHNAVKYLQQAPTELLEPMDPNALFMLWEMLGDPQRGQKYLRFTGNNGKTVCTDLLLSAFRESDYVVGALSLPWQEEGRSNIRINAQPLSPNEITAYCEQVIQAIKALNATLESPLVFSRSELLLTVALLAFREHRCRFCVVESDATPADPTRRLPAPFAAAICGTIPAESPKEMQQIRSYIVHGIQEIVCAPQNQEAYRLISETCASINCRLTLPTKSELTVSRLSLSGSEFCYKNENYKLALCGKFQITNASVVIEIINMLARHGHPLSKEQIFRGLSQARLPAKFEILSVSPTIIADSTHAEAAIDTVTEALADFQPILGKSIHLCLPEYLADPYATSLVSHNFSVQNIFAYDESEKPKEIAAMLLNELKPTDLLLISGHYEKTIKIRDEIFKKFST